MTATLAARSGAGLDRDSRATIRRYYLAMSVPFGIDVLTSAVYAAINAHPLSLVPLSTISAVFLLVGVGIGAWLLIRPVEPFLAGEAIFPAINPALTRLPIRSATLVACLYGP